MKKYFINGIMIFSILSSCYDSDDTLTLTIENTLPSVTNLTVSGNLTVNSTLTAIYTFNDADGDSESGSVYQWYTAEDTDGNNKQIISGATSNTYTLTTNDLNQFIGFEITPHDGIDSGEKKLSSFFGPISSEDTSNLTGQELLDYLKSLYAPPSAANDSYDYDEARDIMYSKIWLQNTDQLTGIYSGYTITIDLTQDPSSDAFNKDINTEHIYPQSKGAENEPMRSDMHHLAPTKSNINSSRGNLPFGNISDSEATKWFQNANQYSSDPDGSAGESEAYSKRNASSFEPRGEVKGDIARAVMYFYTMYDSADASFFESMKVTLLEWHKLDPVDDFERSRNELIKEYQGNENPYILDDSFAERAFSN